MKKFHVVMYSALLLLFCRALCQAQQSLTSTRNSTSTAGGQVVSNVSGTGATDYVPLWLSATKLGNSRIFQSSVGVGIGTTSPAATLDVDGAVNAATSFNLGGTPFAFGTLSKSNAFLGFSGNSTMTGGDNTASGASALGSNTTGVENTASGYRALGANQTGNFNTASGLAALQENLSGGANTATGWETLAHNISGVLNTATGAAALGNNTT